MAKKEIFFYLCDIKTRKIMEAPFIGISRHRLQTDGNGVTTLAAFNGCPLRCHYCLNPQSLTAKGIREKLNPEQLLERVSIDNLYFLATGGGITFGGGEPLLRADFIAEFCKIAPREWRITLETSLNVPLHQLMAVENYVSEYIVDIKDMNPEIYQNYTGKDNENVIRNLNYLIESQKQENILAKIPLIEGYNTNADRDLSEHKLREMGITRIERFKYLTHTLTPIRILSSSCL